MFTQTVKWLFLTLLAVHLLLNVSPHCQVLADSGLQPPPPPIASTNVSTVQAGGAFSMKCSFPDNYTIRDEQFQINFNYDFILRIASYYTKPTASQRVNFRSNLFDFEKQYISSVEPGNSTTTNVSTSSVFEVVVTTAKKEYSGQFYCDSFYNSIHLASVSNYITVNVTVPPSLSPPVLSSNVSTVRLHQPFTLTCSLPTQFNHSNRAYQVAFFNSRDGLMGDYEVDATGKVIFVSKENSHVAAHQGTRISFPNFDLEVRENANRRLSYWCQLITIDSDSHKNISLESTHWRSIGPFVDFNSSHVSENKLRGRCSIKDLFYFKAKEYIISFYSDLGSLTGQEKLLAFFWVRPYKFTEFITETATNTHWTSIVQGASVEYPDFEIVGTLESGLNVTSHNWWCALSYFEIGHTKELQIKSNIQTL